MASVMTLSVFEICGGAFEGEARTVRNQLVLKADVECRVSVGCECHPGFSNNIFWSSILIAHCVLDLVERVALVKLACTANRSNTYMHIDLLAIAFCPIDYCSHKYQCIFCDEVPYTSFVLAVMACVCCEVEFER